MSIRETHPYWLDIDDLMVLFPAYTNRAAVYTAIKNKTFPVHTFRMGGHRYADKETVRAYFRKLRAESLEVLSNGK